MHEWTFVNGVLNGPGRYYEKNGIKHYEGEFLNGRENGKGVSISKEGDKYEGEFLDGKRNGQGVLIHGILSNI